MVEPGRQSSHALTETRIFGEIENNFHFFDFFFCFLIFDSSSPVDHRLFGTSRIGGDGEAAAAAQDKCGPRGGWHCSKPGWDRLRNFNKSRTGFRKFKQKEFNAGKGTNSRCDRQSGPRCWWYFPTGRQRLFIFFGIMMGCRTGRVA